MIESYNENDVVEGRVTKVVTFGAFVEILDGVEGLVHISELAPHHVENPREIVSPGDEVKVKILEIDSERRRLSLSVKRVEGQVLTPKVLPPEEQGAGDLDDLPELGLSEEVFAAAELAPEAPPIDAPAEPDGAADSEDPAAEVVAEAVAEPVVDDEPAVNEPIADEAAAEEPAAEAAADEQPAADADTEPVAAEPVAAEAVADEQPAADADAEPVAAEAKPDDAA